VRDNQGRVIQRKEADGTRRRFRYDGERAIDEQGDAHDPADVARDCSRAS
jgi:YD repeat-containing protein